MKLKILVSLLTSELTKVVRLKMLEKLKKIIKDYNELNLKLTDPSIINDIKMYQKISQDFTI